MNKNKDQLFQAYLDGELSIGESAEFEATLSESERERLSAEMRLESALADRLGQYAECPEDLWNRTLAMVEQSKIDSGEKTVIEFRPTARRRWFIGAVSLVAAACLAFVISVLAPVQPNATSSVVLAAQSVQELVARSEVTAEFESVQDYIHQHSIDLDIHAPGDIENHGHHGVSILGADTEQVGGEKVVELLVECCGYPVKVLMVERDSAIAHEIALAVVQGSDVQAVRSVGRYITAVVSKHPTHNLLDVFDVSSTTNAM